MIRPFRLEEPASLAEAIDLRVRHGIDAPLYAGGTELLLVLKQGFLTAERLINIKTVPELEGLIWDEGAGELVIRARVTHRELELSPLVQERFPTLAQTEALIANVRVRHAGTLVGNLCFAEPHSDPAPVLMAYGADAVVVGPSGTRRVPLDEFFVGPFETALREDELVQEIRVPALPEGGTVAYRRFALRERPTGGVAVRLVLDGAGRCQDARVAVGGFEPAPRRLPEVEALLVGESATALRERTGEVAEAVGRSIEPLVDLYGSDEYKRELAGVLAARALAAALDGGGAATL